MTYAFKFFCDSATWSTNYIQSGLMSYLLYSKCQAILWVEVVTRCFDPYKRFHDDVALWLNYNFATFTHPKYYLSNSPVQNTFWGDNFSLGEFLNFGLRVFMIEFLLFLFIFEQWLNKIHAKFNCRHVLPIFFK